MARRLYLQRKFRDGHVGKHKDRNPVLQDAVNSVTSYESKTFCRQAKLVGASLFFRAPVFEEETVSPSEPEGATIYNKLKKARIVEKEKKILGVLEEWRQNQPLSVWISKTLPVDLNLPVISRCPGSDTLQALVLCVDRPALVLSLYKPEQSTLLMKNEKDEDCVEDEGKTGRSPSSRKTTSQLDLHTPASTSQFQTGTNKPLRNEETCQQDNFRHEDPFFEEVRAFTLETARKLTTHLLDFCHCDFVLLPCAVPYDSFCLESLERTVKWQKAGTQLCFGDAVELGTFTYGCLKAAGEAIASVSYVPFFLSPQDSAKEPRQPSKTPWLLRMDKAWNAVLSLLIESLDLDAFDLQLTYTPETEYKTKAALLEAARRLAFRDHVTVLTKDDLYCLKKRPLEVYTGKEHNAQMQLHITDQDHSDAAKNSVHIYIDFPDVQIEKAGDDEGVDEAWIKSIHIEYYEFVPISTRQKRKNTEDEEVPMKKVKKEETSQKGSSHAEEPKAWQRSLSDSRAAEDAGDIAPTIQTSLGLHSDQEGDRPSALGHDQTRKNPCLHRETLTAQWRERVRDWFPRLHERTYFVPPVHMNKVEYRREQIGDQYVLISLPRVSSVATVGLKSVHESDVYDDQTQTRILESLQCFAAKKKETMVVISQLKFGDYLSAPSYAEAARLFPIPTDLRRSFRRGYFDIVFIHRQYGLFVAVKSVGANFSSLVLIEQQQDQMVTKMLEEALADLKEAGEVLKHLVSDLSPQPSVRKALMLPNIGKSALKRVLDDNPLLKKALSCCLDIQAPAEPSDACLCSDHLPNRGTSCVVSSGVSLNLTEWWDRGVRRYGHDSSMNEDIYEELVARFCGPATQVCVYSPSHEAIQLRTEGEGVSETSRRFGQAVLRPEQLATLKSNEPFVWLCGPPGTGKTFMLECIAQLWFCQGSDVYVVSTSSSSLAASHLIVSHLKNYPTKQQAHLRKFNFTEEGQVEVALDHLANAASHGQLCVVADEAYCGSDFNYFCTALSSRVRGLRLWAASVYRGYRPSCLKEVIFTSPLRTPPVVTREVQQSDLIKDGLVLDYETDTVQQPCDGPKPIEIPHRSRGHIRQRTAAECQQCGIDLADVLMTKLALGEGKTIISTPSATAPRTRPEPLHFRDVFVLTTSISYELCDEKVDETVEGGASGLIAGLRQKGVPVRVVEKGDSVAIADVATMSGPDEVIVADADTVRGLERKVAVWVGDLSDDRGFSRLNAMSRTTAQLVIVESESKDLLPSEP